MTLLYTVAYVVSGLLLSGTVRECGPSSQRWPVGSLRDPTSAKAGSRTYRLNPNGVSPTPFAIPRLASITAKIRF